MWKIEKVNTSWCRTKHPVIVLYHSFSGCLRCYWPNNITPLIKRIRDCVLIIILQFFLGYAAIVSVLIRGSFHQKNIYNLSGPTVFFLPCSYPLYVCWPFCSFISTNIFALLIEKICYIHQPQIGVFWQVKKIHTPRGYLWIKFAMGRIWVL